jgi:hypothetical protein
MKEGSKSIDDNEIRRSLSDEAAPEPRTERNDVAGRPAGKRERKPYAALTSGASRTFAPGSIGCPSAGSRERGGRDDA